jgi:hypothetical protein
MAQGQQWRASKMIGVDVYNQQNEKLGEIDEMLFDQSGKVTGYVIGVGGFLGIGEHDVMVRPDQLRFVNEPRQARTARTVPADDRRTARTAPANDRTTATRPATTGTGEPVRSKDEKWYPDHAILNANKDQLKNMPAFKYE